MGVVSHCYGGLGGGMDGVVVDGLAVQSQKRLVRCQEICEHFLSQSLRH